MTGNGEWDRGKQCLRYVKSMNYRAKNTSPANNFLLTRISVSNEIKSNFECKPIDPENVRNYIQLGRVLSFNFEYSSPPRASMFELGQR